MDDREVLKAMLDRAHIRYTDNGQGIHTDDVTFEIRGGRLYDIWATQESRQDYYTS